MLIFEERGKLEYPALSEKNLSSRVRESNPGHIHLVGGEYSPYCAILFFPPLSPEDDIRRLCIGSLTHEGTEKTATLSNQFPQRERKGHRRLLQCLPFNAITFRIANTIFMFSGEYKTRSALLDFQIKYMIIFQRGIWICKP